MNHSMTDLTNLHLGSATQLFVANEHSSGVPVMVEIRNAGAMPTKLDFSVSSLSSAAVGAEKSDLWFEYKILRVLRMRRGMTFAGCKLRSCKKITKMMCRLKNV